MRNDYELMKELLIGKMDDILKAVCNGQDVEIRKAPNGGIKVLTVKKQLLEAI